MRFEAVPWSSALMPVGLRMRGFRTMWTRFTDGCGMAAMAGWRISRGRVIGVRIHSSSYREPGRSSFWRFPIRLARTGVALKEGIPDAGSWLGMRGTPTIMTLWVHGCGSYVLTLTLSATG